MVKKRHYASLLRLVAKYADMWNGFGDIEAYAHKIEVLNEWCAKEGRNPNDIERTVYLLNAKTNQASVYLLRARA